MIDKFLAAAAMMLAATAMAADPPRPAGTSHKGDS